MKKSVLFSLKNKKLIKAIEWLVVALIILLSLFPRSIDSLNQNPIFGFDQGREYLAAKNIVENHNLILIGTELGAGTAGLSGIFHGPVYYYLLTIPYALFGGNPAGGTILMLLFGLLSIVAGFILGNKIFGKYGGILIALLISIAPHLIPQSRFLWSPNPPTLFIIVCFYFVYLFTKGRKNIYIFWAAFFSAFIYNFEFAISVPLGLTLFIYTIYLCRKKAMPYLFLILGTVVGFVPMILFEIRHNFMGLKGILNYVLGPKKSSGFDLEHILDHLRYFVFNFKDAFPLNNFLFASLFMILLFGSVIYFLSREKSSPIKNFIMFLVLLLPVNFFVFFFLRNTVWGYYLTDLTVAYIILFVYVIWYLYQNSFKKEFVAILVLLIVFVLVGVYSSVKTSIYDYSDYGGTAKLKGKVEAIDYIYQDAKGEKFGLLIFSPPVYTYPYDYIASWYGKNKYGYVPHAEKTGTFYLLIEPDFDKPWSYKGWLETVIKTGKVVSENKLPNGFIVQKRISE